MPKNNLTYTELLDETKKLKTRLKVLLSENKVSSRQNATDKKKQKIKDETNINNERFRLICDLSNNYVFSTILNPDGSTKFDWIEGAFEEITGYSVEEYVARGGWRATIYPADLTIDDKDFLDIISCKEVTSELRTINKAGEIVWVHIFARPVWNPKENRVSAIYGSVKDISERKKFQEALEISERNFRNIFEGATEGIFQASLNGIYSKINPAFAKMFGYKNAEEMISSMKISGETLFADSDTKKKLQKLLLEKGTVKNFEAELRKKNGSTFWGAINAHIVKDSQGKILHFEGTFNDISERKNSEKTIKLSEERYKMIVDNVTDIIWSGDPFSLKFDYLSPAIEKVLGYPVEEALQMKIEKFMTPYSFRNVIDKIKHQMISYNPADEKASVFAIEIDMVSATGEIIPAEVFAKLVIDLPKKYTHLIGITRDISERKKLDSQILAEHRQLVDTLESMTDAFVSLDSNWCYTYMNSRAGLIFSRDPKEMIGKHIWTEFPEGIGQPFYNNYHKAMNEKVFIEMQEYYPPFDKWFENRICPGTNGISIFFQDITERIKSETALRESEEKYRTLIETASDSIFIITNGLIQYVNKVLINISGYSEEELIGQPFLNFVSEKDLESAKKYYTKRMLGLEAPINYETSAILKDGTIIPVETTVSVFNYMGEKAELVFMRDITERKKAEKEILLLNQTLEERVKQRTDELAEANKGLEAFAYSVSHDLRAPLRHIDGFLRILRSNIPQPNEKAEYYFDKIIQSSSKMSLMIDDLLKFSRLGRQEIIKTRVDLNNIISEVIVQFKPETENRQISFTIGKLPVVNGDYNLLKLVFENLISNAIKFTSKKEMALIEINTLETPDKLKNVYVKDNGAGFDMAYADKLFGVFQRLHSYEEFEGTGIGLANIKQIIHKHGATIRAEGEVGKGATFYITF